MRKETKELYKSYGIDVAQALKKLKDTKISLHCWQLDDVMGFENVGSLTGGIQTTGNYPGKARNKDELMNDYKFALSLIDSIFLDILIIFDFIYLYTEVFLSMFSIIQYISLSLVLCSNRTQSSLSFNSLGL